MGLIPGHPVGGAGSAQRQIGLILDSDDLSILWDRKVEPGISSLALSKYFVQDNIIRSSRPKQAVDARPNCSYGKGKMLAKKPEL